MSAIAGIYNHKNQKLRKLDIDRMLDTMSHRGCDGVNIWLRGNVTLGHRMLWTTPESLHEQLPLANCNGDFVITADARIDNRDELIEVLGLNDLPQEKVSDSQIILAAFEKWGEACTERLLGDFAFAIWNFKRKRLFCARDHFGVKPFYYWQGEGTFAFASEIKALLSLDSFEPHLNELRIADYLTVPMLDSKTITVFQDIYRLPPAHCAVITQDGKINCRPYWSLDPSKELKLNSDLEYAERFRQIFTEAVRCRLRSAFPIGTHLSGGLDSSSITSVALKLLEKELGKEDLHTFSNIFDSLPECDEREYIERVLNLGGCIPHYVSADKSSPLLEWEDFFHYFDEPCLGHSHYLVRGLNKAAKQAGVRVVLDGFDGDTTVSHGEEYFVELAKRGDWQRFTEEAKAIAPRLDSSPGQVLLLFGLPYLAELSRQHRWKDFIQTFQGITKHFYISRKKLAIKYGIKPHIPLFILNLLRRLKGKKLEKKETENILNSEFAEAIDLSQIKSKRNEIREKLATVRENQFNALSSGAFTHVLELVDLGAAGFSLESRHPFMDKRLIEFCLSLPAEQKLNQGWTRAILRRAMEGILPPEIQWRGGKTSMKANFDRGLQTQDISLIEEILSDRKNQASKFVNLTQIRQYLHGIKTSDRIFAKQTIPIFQTVILSLWLEHIYSIIKSE